MASTRKTTRIRRHYKRDKLAKIRTKKVKKKLRKEAQEGAVQF